MKLHYSIEYIVNVPEKGTDEFEKLVAYFEGEGIEEPEDEVELVQYLVEEFHVGNFTDLVEVLDDNTWRQ